MFMVRSVFLCDTPTTGTRGASLAPIHPLDYIRSSPKPIMEPDYTDYTKSEDVRLAFEAMAARLYNLDGIYAWNEDVELVRKALEIAGY